MVFAHPGNYDPLTAFDAASGASAGPPALAGFFAAPLGADLAGAHQIITVTQKNVMAVAPPDGRELWQFPWPGGGGGTMPVLHDGSRHRQRPQRRRRRLQAGAQRNGAWTVSKIWETKDVSMYLSNPVVIGDTLFGLSHRSSGQFFALDVPTRQTLWLGEPRQATNTAIVKAGNVLFLLNDDGELIVARASREKLEPIRRYTCRRDADVGAAGDLGQPDLHQGRELPSPCGPSTERWRRTRH